MKRRIISLLLVIALVSCCLPMASAYDRTGYPNTHTNIGNNAYDLISVALTQLGYTEGSGEGDHTKYNEWFYGSDKEVAWCSIFISWCANQASIPTWVLPKNAGARGYTVETMRDNPFGGNPYAFGAKDPQPGDIFFSTTSGGNKSTHTGIVYRLDANYIYTVEGNTANNNGPGSVMVRAYNRTTGYQVTSTGAPVANVYLLFLTRPDYIISTYPDVAVGSYYEAPVRWAVASGITTGTSTISFAPDQVCTRAQAVTFLWRAYGQPEPSTKRSPFYDVTDTGAYFYKAVLWAYENGITTGTWDGYFSPYAPCTRAQIVTFLWRCEGSPWPWGTSPFYDVQDMTTYYYGPVLWAVNTGVTAGTAPGYFSPNDYCTRAQIVTFLYRDFLNH